MLSKTGRREVLEPRLMGNDDNTLASLIDRVKSNPMETGALFINKLSTVGDEMPYSI